VVLLLCAVMTLTNNEQQALKLLSDAANGCTVPFMLSCGCSVAALRHLARCRLAITDRVPVKGKPKSATVVRLRISDAGREALARQQRQPYRRKISVKLILLVLFALGVLAGMGAGALLASH
jgi:hypothetical protein